MNVTGLIAVSLLWIATLAGMALSGLGFVDSRPISYLGVAAESGTFFNTLLFMSAVFFALFAVRLYSVYKTGMAFLVVYIIGQIGQATAAVFKYGGEDKIIHTTAAFLLAASIPIAMYLFAHSKPAGLPAKVLRHFVIAEIVGFVVGIGAFILTEGIAPIAEILPALPFHVWVFYVTVQLFKTNRYC